MGYTGGTKDKPTYHDLGDHTEALQVEFDPARISYETLLRHFWDSHDPATRSFSVQYKPALWFHDAAQERAAHQSADALAERRGQSVQTEIRPATTFWVAEDYHQKYTLRHHKDLIAAAFGTTDVDAQLLESTLAARLNGWLAGAGTKDDMARDLVALDANAEVRALLGKALGRRAPPLCHSGS